MEESTDRDCEVENYWLKTLEENPVSIAIEKWNNKAWSLLLLFNYYESDI